MFRRVGSKSWLGRLGIILLILSLGRVPLPVLDFQGAKHVDAPGHLAGGPQGGSALRLHWVVLNSSALCGSATELGDETPDCHPDGSSCEHDPSPQFVSAKPTRRVASRFTVSPGEKLQATFTASLPTLVKAAPSFRARSFAASYPPGISPASLLQRWVC
jgi:hypothetical protein